MDVSKNRGKTTKMDGLWWKTILKMDDLGGPPLFLETSKYQVYRGLYNPVPKKDSSRPLQGSQQEPMRISWFMSGFGRC